MNTPLLHRQLHQQLRQWITPKDKRHLRVFCENVSAILQAESGCMSHWLSYLRHRPCHARSHMERLHYFVHNPNITAETFYAPLVRQFLKAWQGSSITLTLDTSLLWNQYCLIEVCLVWGGRSFALAQKVIEHRSSSVAFADYCSVLAATLAVLPPGCEITLLADRGFEQGDLIRWLQQHQWFWLIRAKSDLNITLSNGRVVSVGDLRPDLEHACLFRDVMILKDIPAQLALAHLSMAGESWAVITNTPLSIQTFARYGQRFGGIEPHFKDYKSAGFELTRSRLRDALALARLLMLLAAATLIALVLAVQLAAQGNLKSIDWHSQRGLSFLQIGLRFLRQLCYLGKPLPLLKPLPKLNPHQASASLKKKRASDTHIEFAKVTVF